MENPQGAGKDKWAWIWSKPFSLTFCQFICWVPPKLCLKIIQIKKEKKP